MNSRVKMEQFESFLILPWPGGEPGIFCLFFHLFSLSLNSSASAFAPLTKSRFRVKIEQFKPLLLVPSQVPGSLQAE